MSKEIKKLEVDQILNWFKSGEKQQSDWLIGTEHEKFLYNKSNFKRLKYNDKFGIKGLLEQIAIDKSWKPIMENDNIIGLKHLGGSSTITWTIGQFGIYAQSWRYGIRYDVENLHYTSQPRFLQ